MYGARVLGDNAYDTDAALGLIEGAGDIAVIPSKSNWKSPCSLDQEINKICKLIKYLFGRIKEYHRVAARYDKTVHNFRSTPDLTISRFLLRKSA